MGLTPTSNNMGCISHELDSILLNKVRFIIPIFTDGAVNGCKKIARYMRCISHESSSNIFSLNCGLDRHKVCLYEIMSTLTLCLVLHGLAMHNSYFSRYYVIFILGCGCLFDVCIDSSVTGCISCEFIEPDITLDSCGDGLNYEQV